MENVAISQVGESEGVRLEYTSLVPSRVGRACRGLPTVSGFFCTAPCFISSSTSTRYHLFFAIKD